MRHWTTYVTAPNIRVLSMVLGIIATVILTVHVIILHNKIQPDQQSTNDTKVLATQNESIEQGFLVASLVIYIVVFLLNLWASIIERDEADKRTYRLEKHLGIDLHDFTDIRMSNVKRQQQRDNYSTMAKHKTLKQTQGSTFK